MSATAWQRAEVAGPKKALAITKPQVVSALIKRAKTSVMVAGHKVTETAVGNQLLVDYLIDLATLAGIPVVATAHVVGEFDKRGYRPKASMSLVDVCNRLTDASWSLGGDGSHDLALFAGHDYYMQWLALSGLKHAAPQLKTISLDRYYQPHATWSFPNLSEQEWCNSLRQVLHGIGGR